MQQHMVSKENFWIIQNNMLVEDISIISYQPKYQSNNWNFYIDTHTQGRPQG